MISGLPGSASLMEGMALFNRCTRDLAELLRALKRPGCALCGVLGARTREFIRSAAGSTRPETRLLCVRHLAFALERIEDTRTKANLLRSSVILGSESGIASEPACPIRGQLDHITATLQRAIRRLDARARFQKAIEAGALFCCKHRDQICSGNVAPHFARVQQAKLKRLTDELARADRGGGVEGDRVIAQTLGYLHSEVPFTANSKLPGAAQSLSQILNGK